MIHEDATSGPIPKFVSTRSTFRYELRNLRTTSNSMILVPLLNPKFATAFAAQCARTSGTRRRRGRPSPAVVSSHAKTGMTADGRRHARIAVGADLGRAPCGRNGARRRGGEDPCQLDRGAVRLDAAPSGEARADEEQRQELRLRADALPRHARGHH